MMLTPTPPFETDLTEGDWPLLPVIPGAGLDRKVLEFPAPDGKKFHIIPQGFATARPADLAESEFP